MADLFDIDHGSLRDRVLALLWDLNWHGNAALARVGGVRYNARVHELRRLGYRIDDESDGRADGKRYRLVSQEPTGPLTKRVKVFFSPDDARVLLGEGRLTMTARAALEAALRSYRRNADKL